MKFYLSLFSVFLLNTLIYCQNTFEKTYLKHTYYNSIIELENGDFIAAGANDELNIVSDFYISKISSEGDLLWNSYIDIEGKVETASEIIKSHESGFIVVGTSADSSNVAVSVVALMKIDNDGNLENYKTFEIGGFLNWFSITPIAGDKYAITARRNNDGYHWVVITVDENFNVIWEKELGEEGNCFVTKPSSDGGILLSGSGSSGGDSDGSLRCIKLSSSGTVVWDFYLEIPGSNTSTEIYKTIEIEDGNFLFTGTSLKIIPTGNYNFEFIDDLVYGKLDNNGELLWYEASSQLNESDRFRGSRIIDSFDNGDILLIPNGRTQNNTKLAFFVMRTNSIGEQLWVKKFEFENGISVNDGFICKDGGVAAIGYTSDEFGFNGYFIKLDENGEFTSINSINPQPKLNFNILPTINNGNFELKWEGKDYDEVLVRITDKSGKLVFDKTINQTIGENTFEVDELNNLNNGVYFVSLQKDKSIITKQFILQK